MFDTFETNIIAAQAMKLFTVEKDLKIRGMNLISTSSLLLMQIEGPSNKCSITSYATHRRNCRQLRWRRIKVTVSSTMRILKSSRTLRRQLRWNLDQGVLLEEK